MKAMLLQFFYSANGPWRVFQKLFLLLLAMPVSWAIRLYPEILERFFQSLPAA